MEIIFAAWLILALLDADYRPKKSLILYAILTFVGVVGLATIFSVDVVKSFWSNFERMEGFISLLHLLVFFLVISSIFREIDWKRWWNTTLFASGLMIVYVLLQLAGMVTINQGGARVDGTFGNATYLAVYMLFHIFIAGLFLYRERKTVVLKWLYILLILGQLFILYHTATRGAILGLLGGLLIIAILNLRNKEDVLVRKTSIALLVFLALLVGGFVSMRQGDFVQKSPVLSRFTQLSISNVYQGRYFVWPMAIEGFKENPLLGWGQENFVYIFQKHYSPDMFNLEPWFDRAHNAYLDWLVAAGLLGFLGYLSLYVSLLYLIWKSGFSHFEKSMLIGLLAAYGFHNFFVFDHLISYILFFSLLAYVHSRGSEHVLWKSAQLPESWVKKVALPAVLIAVLLPFYFWNIKPLAANAYLIEAFKSVQLGKFEESGKYFRKAYGASILGRTEVVQHLASNSIAVLESSLSLEKKNEFYAFAKEAVVKEADKYPDDAKLALLTGGFLTSTGFPDEALIYLEKARTLIPGKQQVYFDMGSAYFAKGDSVTGLALFKQAYDLAPNYLEAKAIYLIGAVYAKDRTVENGILSKMTEREIVLDQRILSAYYSQNRFEKVIEILESRKKLDPNNAPAYDAYIKEVRSKL